MYFVKIQSDLIDPYSHILYKSNENIEQFQGIYAAGLNLIEITPQRQIRFFKLMKFPDIYKTLKILMIMKYLKNINEWLDFTKTSYEHRSIVGKYVDEVLVEDVVFYMHEVLANDDQAISDIRVYLADCLDDEDIDYLFKKTTSSNVRDSHLEYIKAFIYVLVKHNKLPILLGMRADGILPDMKVDKWWWSRILRDPECDVECIDILRNI